MSEESTHTFLYASLIYLCGAQSGASASCAVREFANKSAASAASRDYVKFQAMIKSAASAASRKPKSREGSSREVPRGRCPPAEAVVLHFPGASFPGFGLPGGCASSRLDHGLKFPKIQKIQKGFPTLFRNIWPR